MMDVERFDIEGPLLLKPRVFRDDRGQFQETWNHQVFTALVGETAFVQDNESVSAKGVLRGLHLQLAPHAQGKLVRVAHGAVRDVIVDVRPGSRTYGQHLKVRLDDKARTSFWIPPGFAHGFVALEDQTIFQYKCTELYHPESERTIRWDDPMLGIDWGIADPIISQKDRDGALFTGPWHEPKR
jgi:dTDP-4-dehydrorhamnose 3,5-epimerase